MTLTVVNPKTEEEAAMFGDEMLDLARRFADQLAAAGGDRWVVIKTTTKEELIYQTSEDEENG
jgi:hypothetical protein